MDLYIDRNHLADGLARVQGVVERRSTTPVLSHALLHATTSGLRITATDTEVAYIGDLEANVEKRGEVAVDAHSLFQIIRSFPDPTVHMVLQGGNRLELTCGRSTFRLPGVSAEEYPALPAFDARGTASMTAGGLRRLVEQTSFCVATDDARYGLNGAHVESVDADSGTRLRMVATDGHRLAAADGSFEGELAITPRMLVPRKALAVLRRLLESGDQEIELSFGEGAIRIAKPGQTFWFRLLDGEFPEYRSVLPRETKHRITMRRGDLISALKRVSILVQERTRAVRFAFGEGEVEVKVHNVDRGEVTETVPVELEGEALTVGFNVRYVLDVLGALHGDRVQFEMAHALGQCLIRDPELDDAFFVVMPMRLD